MPELTQAEKFAQEAARLNPPPPGRGWKYYVKRSVIYLASAYLLLCAIFFFFQNRIVYRGAGGEMAIKSSVFGPMQGQDIELQTTDSVTLSGWHLAANAKSFKKLSNAPLVILFFGGHEGNRSAHDDKFCRFLSMGVDVVCFDYRGFGDSQGRPSEEIIAKDARAVWNYALKEGVSPGNIVLYGEELGGAVVVRLSAELAAEKSLPGGAIVDSSFSKFLDVEHQIYSFLPVRLLMTQRYRSIDRIAAVESPLLMFHGRLDTIVPLASARALFDAAPAKSSGDAGIPKQFVEFPDCDHDNVAVENAAEYDEALSRFFKTLSPVLAARAPHGRTIRPPKEKIRPPKKVRKKDGATPDPMPEPTPAPAPIAPPPPVVSP